MKQLSAKEEVKSEQKSHKLPQERVLKYKKQTE